MQGVAASVRQLDWRLLLPAPDGPAFDHLLLLGGSDEIAAAALALGVARRVTRCRRPGDRADAVVVLAGASDSIEDAVAQLRDGGALYWEVDRLTPNRLMLTPARARTRLRRLGLTPAHSFWVKPGFPERHMYLPLATMGPMRWYLDTLYRSATVRRRLLKIALRAAASHRRIFGALAPCYAITAARGPVRRPALLEEASRHGAAVSERAEPLVLAHGMSEWNRIAVLLFEPRAAGPAAAVKLPRRPIFNAGVEWEHACLGEVGAALAPAAAASVPSSVLFRWSGLAVSVETCVKGASLHSRAASSTRTACDDVRRAAEWLGDFHACTASERVGAREWLRDRLVRQQASQYAAAFGLTPFEERFFAIVSDQLDRTEPGALPLVWQHGDFGPWNIYRDGDQVSVIDWEIARRGPALVDLLYLATHAVTSRVREDARRQEFARLFCDRSPSGPLARACRTAIEGYMRRLGLAASLLPVMLAYTLVEQALERARRLREVESANPADRDANCYVDYLDVLARSARPGDGSAAAAGLRLEWAS